MTSLKYGEKKTYSSCKIWCSENNYGHCIGYFLLFFMKEKDKHEDKSEYKIYYPKKMIKI